MCDFQREFDETILVSDCGCWVWGGAFNNGHPAFKSKNLVRKFVKESKLKIDPRIKPRLTMTCGNKKCVNPDHFYFANNISSENIDLILSSPESSTLISKRLGVNICLVSSLRKSAAINEIVNQINESGSDRSVYVKSLIAESNRVIRDALNVIDIEKKKQINALNIKDLTTRTQRRTEDEILNYLIHKHYPQKSPARISAMAVTYKLLKGRNRTEITKKICDMVGISYGARV